MGITLIAVGGLKEDYWQAAQKEYVKRLSRFCKVDIREIKEERERKNSSSMDIKQLLLKEEQSILKAIPEKAHVVALAMEGQALSSLQLAEKLSHWQRLGYGRVCFVVGGSYGLGEEVKRKSHFLWSFSPLTFPHQLFRLMLLEQIYRGFKINAGETYHK